MQLAGPPRLHRGWPRALWLCGTEDVRPLAGDADDAVEAQTSQMQNSMSMSLPMFMSPTTSEIGEPASPSPSLPPRGKTLYLDIDMDGRELREVQEPELDPFGDLRLALKGAV